MTLIVDPWHWLTEEGGIPSGEPRLRRNTLRVARVIEYGGTLQPGEARETLIECTRRPGGHACEGLLVVIRTRDDKLDARCPVCHKSDMLVSNWKNTLWALGPPEPRPVE